MIHFEKLSTKFKVRALVETDIPVILEVYKSNPLYFEHCPPSPTKEISAMCNWVYPIQ